MTLIIKIKYMINLMKKFRIIKNNLTLNLILSKKTIKEVMSRNIKIKK
jgi:hypothetical protein